MLTVTPNDDAKYFILFDDILEIFNKFVDLFQNNFFKGERKEEEIILQVKNILIDFSLNIPKKGNIEMNEFMKQLNEENIELKRKIKELEKEKSKKEIEIKPNKKNKNKLINKKIFIYIFIIYCFIQITLLLKLYQIIEKKIKFKDEVFENNLKDLQEQIDDINDNSFYSTIILNNEEKNLISNWIEENSKKEFKLIFKSSLNDDLIKTFHEKCDNKNNTLIIIKSSNGKKFGGYNPLLWNISDKYNNDSKTFLFSLDLKIKFIIEKENEINFASIGKNDCILFGNGDLCIIDMFTKSDKNYSKPCSFNIINYQLTGGYENCKVDELEVYCI